MLILMWVSEIRTTRRINMIKIITIVRMVIIIGQKFHVSVTDGLPAKRIEKNEQL